MALFMSTSLVPLGLVEPVVGELGRDHAAYYRPTETDAEYQGGEEKNRNFVFPACDGLPLRTMNLPA
jgi:hypothetical protein